MPKIVDAEVEQQKIIDAFQQCVLQKPLAQVSLRDIAKEAGISHTKIFSYFKSKDEIVIVYAKQIIDRYSSAFENVIVAISEEKQSKKEVFQQLISELYRLDPNNIVEKLYAQIYVLGQYNEEMHQVVLEAYSRWRHALDKLLQANNIAGSESHKRSLLVLIEGILIYRMNDALSQEEAMEIISDLFVEE